MHAYIWVYGICIYLDVCKHMYIQYKYIYIYTYARIFCIPCCILYEFLGWLVKKKPSVTPLNLVLPQTKSTLPGSIAGFVWISITDTLIGGLW